MAEPAQDKELQLYRGLLETPDEFKDGFGWTTFVGILFCGVVMIPGSIYLGLMSGGNVVNRAASWVTLILFSEIARRSLKAMNKQQLVILLHAAQVIMAGNALFPGGPVAQLVYRGFLVRSDAMRDSGMSDYMPEWFVPAADSAAVVGRNLLDPAWLVPIGILFLVITIGFVRRYTLGYFFFRLTSDVEDLPFPLAPIQAQGSMALAEADQKVTEGDAGKQFFSKKEGVHKKKSEKWRLFSLGAVIGVVFGFIQLGVPALTSVFLDKPVFLIPQPFIDTTTLTEGVLPATPTGIAFDLGIVLLGMVIPFWAVMGTGFAIIGTIIANPILHEYGILTAWQPGMDTVATTFANEKNFWMSFTIGVSLGLLVVSLYQSFRDIRTKMKQVREKKAQEGADQRENVWDPPVKGRGDLPIWLALGIYSIAGLIVVLTSYLLLTWTGSRFMGQGTILTVTLFILLFVFIYTPLISYLNARLLGIAGQTVEIPYMKQTAFILSGAKGLEIWMIPDGEENYGNQAQAFRVMELTGTSFWSVLKTDAVAFPLLFLFSFVFWAFIWAGNEIPGPIFPFADVFWELQSKRMALQWSATFVTPETADQPFNFWQTEFGQAVKPDVISVGGIATIVGFIFMSIFGMPVMFIYGVIKGVGQFPHMFVLEFVGALLGRFYFQKKFGKERFLRMVPTILAGYFTGVGLIGMFTVAMDLIKKAVSTSPF